MARRSLVSRVDRYAGLSDRAVPLHLSRIESPDLLNVEFQDYNLKRRKGFSRFSTEQFRDSSLRFNGFNSNARIPYQTYYDPAVALGVWFHCKLGAMPVTEQTLISRGYGTSTARFLQISYDPTINSNLGGWRLRLYDPTAGSLVNQTVNDGDTAQTQVGAVRYIVFDYDGTGNDFSFSVYDEDGTSIGTTGSFVVQSVVSDTFDWFLGCDTSDGVTVPGDGDDSFFNGSMAELLIANDTNARTMPLIAGRELRSNASDDELTTYNYQGYWKMNDGNGTQITDYSSNANHGFVDSSGAEWVTDQTKITGTSGLRFTGGSGHVQLDASAAASNIFTAPTGGHRGWCFTCVFTPSLGPGEATVRNQTIFWSGDGTGDPEPLGIRVVSDQIQVDYKDSVSVKTATVPVLLSTLDGVKCRLFVEHRENAGGGEVIRATLHPSSVSGPSSSGNTATSDADPPVVGDEWTVGRRVSSQVPPFSYVDNSGYGWLSDFAIFKNYNPATSTGQLSIANGFLSVFGGGAPLADAQLSKHSGATTFGPINITRVWSMGLEDGVGHSIATGGTQTTTAQLLPEFAVPFSWDAGLVVPDRSPEITLFRDYRRLLGDGSFRRSMVAICGTSLYEIDPSDGSVTLISGSLPKGGKWSSDQYADKIYLACNNGSRPVVFDGTQVSQVGIEAPGYAPLAAESNTAGGQITASTYWVYVTYRNAETGVESNPSPAQEFVITAPNDTIDSIYLPVSPDPQVNQRRVWITNSAASGAVAGSTAYLLVTVEDNTTTQYTTDIDDLTSILQGSVTLDYSGNEAAPQGSVVAVWKDRLWVGGNTEFPTRVYRSTAATLTGFEPAINYEDSDLDAGDPVIGLEVLRDNLIVYLRDGRVALSATGDTNLPFFLSRLNQDVGAVSEHSILVYENRHLFLGERDIWLWAGDDATNLSTPTERSQPSVQRFIRDTINDAQKSNASIAIDRSRATMWLAVATGSNTRNDTVLTLDISQGVWSKYDLPLDIVAEIEDDNDEPTLYGAAEGYILKLNDTNGDGTQDTEFTISSGTTGTLVSSGASWTPDEYKGLRGFVLDASTGEVEEFFIARNDTTTLYLRDALSFTPVSNDTVCIGAIDWFVDFDVDFGSTLDLKVLRWMAMSGFIDGTAQDDYNIRVIVEPDVLTQSWTPTDSSVTMNERNWADTTRFMEFRFGGLGRSWRMRICGNGLAGIDNNHRFPINSPPFSLGEFRVEAEEVSAR